MTAASLTFMEFISSEEVDVDSGTAFHYFGNIINEPVKKIRNIIGTRDEFMAAHVAGELK